MELTELKNKFLNLLNTDDISKAQSELMTVLFDCEKKEKIFDDWLEFCPDLSKDYMQIIYQYYYADRTKGKSQDFTPPSLARLITELTKSDEEKVIVDMCAGSGALTIQKWNSNKELQFICLEYDESVIPFLLSNMAMRNIKGYVYQCDVLSCEVFAVYRLTRGEKYSDITKTEGGSLNNIKVDSCISNPPYNVKWEAPAMAQLQNRFKGFTIPPDGNANYVFVLSALNYAEKSVLILPCSALNTKGKEQEIVKRLAEMNYIEAVILCPNNMFEATDIGVCVIVLNKHKSNVKIEFLDMRNNCNTENRKQKGQFGGKRHTNRVYTKIINTFGDEHIKHIIDCIKELKNIKETAISKSIEEISKNKYNLLPSVYIEFEEREEEHRNYADIINDLNRCRKKKNCCKLVINETIAKQIGFDVEALKQDNKPMGNEEFLEKLSGVKLEKSDYIMFTKKKNEVMFKNNSKDEVSEIFMCIFNMWKYNIYAQNNEENRYLTELKNALLPDLMSGKIDVSEVEMGL